MHKLIAAAVFLCTLAGTDTAAQGIGVSPVYLALRPEQAATSVRVENGGAAARAFEIDVRAWDQDDGHDMLSDTRAFIVSPSVFEVPAGATQIVRIARRPGQAANTNEQSYRVLVREIADETDAAATNGLRLQLEFSLPLFLNTAGGAPDLAAHWTESGLEIVNQGGAHARLSQVRVGERPLDGVPRYLLAGESFVRPVSAGGDVRVRMPGASADLVLDAQPRDRVR